MLEYPSAPNMALTIGNRPQGTAVLIKMDAEVRDRQGSMSKISGMDVGVHLIVFSVCDGLPNSDYDGSAGTMWQDFFSPISEGIFRRCDEKEMLTTRINNC